jgi:peptidoglycan hydrolase CwlO-like protein
MRNIILPILAVTLVLLGISFYLHPVRGSTTTTTTTTTTNTTYTNTTWTNTSLPPQVQQLENEVASLNFPIMSLNQTQTTTTQTTSVQTSTTKVTSQQWYVQYAPEIVIAILITLLGLLYKRRSKK